MMHPGFFVEISVDVRLLPWLALFDGKQIRKEAPYLHLHDFISKEGYGVRRHLHRRLHRYRQSLDDRSYDSNTLNELLCDDSCDAINYINRIIISLKQTLLIRWWRTLWLSLSLSLSSLRSLGLEYYLFF